MDNYKRYNILELQQWCSISFGVAFYLASKAIRGDNEKIKGENFNGGTTQRCDKMFCAIGLVLQRCAVGVTIFLEKIRGDNNFSAWAIIFHEKIRGDNVFQ